MSDAKPLLEIEHFAQIKEARIQFGDLTVLVGPQASGKSLVLQWLKVALDAGEVIPALKEAGHDVKVPEALIDLVFGEGMSSAWKADSTSIKYDGKTVSPSHWLKGLKKKRHGSVFFIPAHRALLLSDGWPAPFMKLNADTPVVARLFSQNLYQRFSGRQESALFPVGRLLKKAYREAIDRSIFHGGTVNLQKEGFRYRLRLEYPDVRVKLPFMTWTAGQREFSPLLLGLYHVLVPRNAKKRSEVDWVVIEEPEMGLHPQAISVVILLVLDLLWRGYRVVVSTHSPLVLDAIWAIRRLAEHGADWRSLCDAFGVPKSQEMSSVMQDALKREFKVYFMSLDQQYQATAKDISALDPESADPAEADWGGLTGFSSRFGDAVRKAVSERDQA